MKQIKHILSAFFNTDVREIKKLDGYISTNYRLDTKQGKYILKVYADNKETTELVEAENTALSLFRGHRSFPQLIKNSANQELTFTNDKVYRLLSFVEGTCLAQSAPTPKLFERFGAFLANMDLQLAGLKNYRIEARHFNWDLQHFQATVAPKVNLISNPGKRKLVEYVLLQHRELVVPQLPGLRKQIIHNDANDWNVLVNGESISGIIDFGDICHTQLINELAIAITYAVMGKKDPVNWAFHLVKGYGQQTPLNQLETDLLYWLVAARLCTSVCNSAEEKIKQPANNYIAISEKPAWQLLKKWLSINPVYAKNQFRKAAGIDVTIEKSIEEVQQQRFSSVNPILSVSYKKPIYMEQAAFQYMFDKYGNSYLDAYNNIPHVGHSHPRVVEAGQKQMARLNTNTRYLYDQLNQYTASLLNYFPEKLNKVFLVNSGSAASDLAIRLVRHFTGRKRIAALEYGYHGNTNSVIEISHYKFAGKGGNGASDQVLPLPLPDAFRGKPSAEQFTNDAIKKINQNEIAAFIAEPIVGCGGQVPLTQNYLMNVYAAVKAQGGLCISDEVQTGFGRLGDVFWGYEMYHVVPDIVILGKPMGNGHPIGAVVTTSEIADVFNNGMEFFSSFGGNPVSCAIGQAVLNVLEEEQLQQNAKEVGNYYLERLRQLQLKFECIGDVRGAGLFIGVELVKNRFNNQPNTQLAQRVKNELRNRFILVSTDGPYNNVIKSKPPLCFTKANVDEVIKNLEEILATDHKK
ncbi:aminotransferase class III-fold pyridoxal phosphate-dependent enzyme [uncultured Draconibacterium sp.]|uniref:aminotransferase class III-fold pyridoxal phosphate-dependent enzyme n=1 Tax=uncultured Draconibacterium sp. TaxID=1573823 RepID=UPI0032601F9D